MSGPFDGPVDRSTVVDRIESHPIEGGPEEQRQAFAELVIGDDSERLDGGAVDFAGEGGTIVYLHGGGYVFGSPRTHERIGATLAELTGLAVTMPAYPLAPEHPWPAQLDAAMAAVGQAQGPVVLAGDSAGGHLALVTALESRRRGVELAGLVLFSPNTDRTGLSTTRQRNEPSDPMVDDEGDRALAHQCFGNLPDDDPQVSPLLDDLRLLPPLHVEVGDGEVLFDDSRLLAEAARAAGVEVTLHVEPGGLHMMQLWTPWWEAAADSLERAAAFATEVTGRSTTGRDEPQAPTSGPRESRPT